MILSGQIKPLADQMDIASGRSYARRRFLLEYVKHVDSVLEPDSVDGPVGIPTVVFDNLEDPSALPLPRFCIRMFPTKLGHA